MPKLTLAAEGTEPNELGIDDAVSRIRQYRQKHRLTIEHYDFGEGSQPDRVTSTDIGRLILIEPLQQSDVVELFGAGDKAPWELVPTDARLDSVEADSEGELYQAAAKLFDHFTQRPGIGTAKASKLLHLKRPHFFPILDSRVLAFFDEPASRLLQASERWRDSGRKGLWWAAIRSELLHPGNRAAFDEIRLQLQHSPETDVRRLAQLPLLRLLDILVWQQ